MQTTSNEKTMKDTSLKTANVLAQQDLLKRPIVDFIPHRPPMVLIDKILSHQQDCLTVETLITENSPYFEKAKQGVPSYVCIEYMAQSVAALAGVEALMANEPIKIGFLLGSRKLTINEPLLRLGQSYVTKVNRLYQEESGLAVFDCQVFHHDTLIASANVNVFQPTDTQAFIENQE